MGMNNTPAAERVHIGFFGRRNAGKSSILNAVTNQELAVVSEIKGTTTDPVHKTMELLPLGPVMLIDTPGIDDGGELGEMRVKKSFQVMNKIDVAVLVVDGAEGISDEDKKLEERLKDKKIPYIIAYNKADLKEEKYPENSGNSIWVSAKTREGINELKEMLSMIVKTDDGKGRIVGDLISPSDFVILVVPVDKAAPKGRLILPQQQTIRDILDADAVSIVVKEYELKNTLKNIGKKPKLVITDSQAFEKVSADTPDDIMLTSFSILFARYKGNLETLIRGVKAVDNLRDNDRVLISEGCTHHRQCDDIGSVKLPRWIKEYTGKNIIFEFTSGTEFPENISKYSLIIHCGGCMLNEREMKYRLSCARDCGIPITNYGILIAHMQGILKRSTEVFPEIAVLLSKLAV